MNQKKRSKKQVKKSSSNETSNYKLARKQVKDFLDDKEFKIVTKGKFKYLMLTSEEKYELLVTKITSKDFEQCKKSAESIIRYNQFKSLTLKKRQPYLDFLKVDAIRLDEPLFPLLHKMSAMDHERIEKLDKFYVVESDVEKINIDEVKDIIHAVIKLQLEDNSEELLIKCREALWSSGPFTKKKVSSPIRIKLYGIKYSLTGKNFTMLINFLKSKGAIAPFKAKTLEEIADHFSEEFPTRTAKTFDLSKLLEDEIMKLEAKYPEINLKNEILNRPYDQTKGIFLNRSIVFLED